MTEKPLFVYDGDCAFCTAGARRLADRAPIRAVASQDLGERGLGRLGLDAADVRDAAYWIDGDVRLRGHLAVAQALASSTGWRSVCGRLLLVPPVRWLGAALYPLVARTRHRPPPTG